LKELDYILTDLLGIQNNGWVMITQLQWTLSIVSDVFDTSETMGNVCNIYFVSFKLYINSLTTYRIRFDPKTFTGFWQSYTCVK
jgi:hypothetical protein